MIDDKVIVGAMLVSQSSDILDISIPNLLQFCDWVMVMMDNESPEVVEKVNNFQKQYYDKIWVRRSSIPSKVFSRHGNLLTYHERWKSCKGVIRNDVLNSLKSILLLGQKGFEKIDILLWADHDTIFTDSLPELLEKFIDSDKKAISMKHVDAIGDMRTIAESSIGHHVHVLKWDDSLSGLPRRFFALYYPLTESDVMKVDGYSVHLAYLTDKNREWRNKFWKTDNIKRKLYHLDKSVVEMKPEEINNITCENILRI